MGDESTYDKFHLIQEVCKHGNSKLLWAYNALSDNVILMALKTLCKEAHYPSMIKYILGMIESKETTLISALLYHVQITNKKLLISF